MRVRYVRERAVEHWRLADDKDPAPLSGLRVADVGCGGGVLSEVRTLDRLAALVDRGTERED